MIGSDYLAPLPDREFTSKQAKIAMGLAVAVHLGTFFIGIFSPYLLNRNSRLPEIYTVNLVAVTEPAARPAPKPTAARNIEPATQKKAVKTSPDVVKPPPPAAPPKTAISTRPIRRKTHQDQNAVDTLRKQLHTEQQAEKAAEDAKKALTDALAALRQTLHSEPRVTIDISAKAHNTGVSGPSGGQIVAEAKRQYFAAVYEKVKEHFILPDLKTWKPDLQSVLVIEVRRDGIVVKSSFEEKSDNLFFNQAVEKALSEASPLPPFPPELKESQLEFGLRFRPGDLL